MHYIIYPDTLFMENLICNLLFLTFMKHLFFSDASWKRVFLASAVTAFCNTLISILFFRYTWILQIGVLFPASGIMVCSCLQIKEMRRILYALYRMILWTLIAGGILQMLEQWGKIYTKEIFLAVGMLVVLFGFAEKVFGNYQKQNDCMRDVVLYWNGRCCSFRGFADTGNQLMDPMLKKPVSIISKESWELLVFDSKAPLYHVIPCKTVNDPYGMLQGAQIDYMVITQKGESRIYEKPVLAVTEQPFGGIFHYSILLHNEYF